MNALSEIVNLKEYPINNTESAEYKKLIEHNRKLLDKDLLCQQIPKTYRP